MTQISPEHAAALTADRDGITWVDTRDMEWGTFPGLGGGSVKVLHVDEEGVPYVMAVWMPPGELPVEYPHRHYHASVYEHAFHLGGDLPHGEWPSGDDEHELVIFREHYFLDRKPGSLHGLDTLYSDTGCVVLCWRSGTGNWVDEPEAVTETLGVEIGDGFTSKSVDEAKRGRPRDGVVIDRSGARVVDTREMDWTPLGGGLARERVLTRGHDGLPTVRMLFLPPGEAGAPALALAEGDREFAMVLEGEYVVAGDDGPLRVREGFFMNRAPGAPEGLVPAGPSVTGAVVLQWRMGDDTFPFPNAAE